MKIICTLNLKGGCAKTTTAVSMAELLANGFKSKNGKIEPGKVLLFDNIKQLNRKAHLAGVLITDYEKTDTSEAAETWLRTKSGLPVFDAIIRHSKKVNDSTFYHKTPISYCVRSGAAQGYKKFILEYTGNFITAAGQKERV